MEQGFLGPLSSTHLLIAKNMQITHMRFLRSLTVSLLMALVGLSSPKVLAQGTTAPALNQETASSQSPAPVLTPAQRAYELANQGEDQFGQLQLRAALGLFKQALDGEKKLGNQRRVAYLFQRIGTTYILIKESNKAFENYQQSLAVYEILKDIKGQEEVLQKIGNIYESLGQHEKAIATYQKSLSLQKDSAARLQASTLYKLGMAYESAGRADQAIQSYQSALVIQKKFFDRFAQRDTLIRTATVYQNKQQYPQALEALQQALTVERETFSQFGQQQIFKQIAGVYLKLNEPQKALDSYEQALKIARGIKDRKGEKTILTNMAIIYEKMQQQTKAQELYQQAEALGG